MDRTINTNSFNKRIVINNNPFNLNIWDTAGEEKYHAIAPMYYRGADGAIIIYDVTKKETIVRAKKWVEELRKFAENDPCVIFVGNKVDKINERILTMEDGNKLANEYQCPYFESSAKNGQNITEIFDNITLNIYQKKIREINELKKQEEDAKKNKKVLPKSNLRKIAIIHDTDVQKKIKLAVNLSLFFIKFFN